MKKFLYLIAIAMPTWLFAQSPQPPVITSPTNGSSVSTAQPIASGTESADGAVIDVYANDNYIGAVFNDKSSTPNWSLLPANYNATLIPEDTFALTATATLNGETSDNSNSVAITVLGVPVITSPASGSITGSQPTFSGTTPLGTQVQVFQGATLLGNATVSGTNWTFTPAQPLVAGLSTFTAVATSSTTITQYPTTNDSTPYLITQGSDGNLWFTYNSSAYIGQITTKGAINNFPILNDEQRPVIASAITAGPDGLLYFTGLPSRETPAYIGSITVDGTVTLITISGLPTNANLPGITTGPDGQIWFAETPLANLWFYNIKTQASDLVNLELQPNQLTTGPDGRIWFSCGSDSFIGATFTTNPTPDYYQISSPSSGITAGPDGNIWFTEPAINKIGVMKTDGTVINEFDIPTANSSPTIITSGSDGNLWFTETSADKIGRITPAGVITEFPIPAPNGLKAQTDNGPVGITTGPDGNIWFADNVGANIGTMGTGLTGTSAPITLTITTIPVSNAYGTFLYNKYCK